MEFNMKTKLLIISALLLLCVSTGFAQQREYEIGKSSELKGLKKIFIDTDDDLQNRDRVTKEINKAKLGLEWVEKIEDAEIVITFKANSNTIFGLLDSKFLVFLNSYPKARLVMTYENRQQSGWEQKPTTKFAKEFIKAYKEANQSK